MQKRAILHLHFSELSIIGVLLTLSLLLGGQYRIPGYIGFFGALALLILQNGVKFKIDPINRAILALIIVVMIGFLVSITNGSSLGNSIGDMLRYYLIFFAAIITYNSRIDDDKIDSVLGAFISSFVVLLIACFIQVGMDFRLLETNTIVTTQIGSDIFLVICAILYRETKRKASIALIIFFIIIEYLAESRAALFASLVLLLIYWALNILKKGLKHANLLFAAWIALCLMIPSIYVWIYTSKYSSAIEAIFLNYTGHRFFSGRQFMWVRAFDVLLTNPLIGRGVGFRLDTSNLYAGAMEGMSVHNFFLYILMQMGIVGFFLFCYLFFVLWKQYSDIGTKQANCLRAFLLALLLQQTFSLGLVSGKMGFAFVCWFLLLIGAKRSEDSIS